MSGVLPATLADLDQLEELTIRNNNKITGPIPEGVWDLPKLEIVNFWGCRLTGPMPAGAARATQLNVLDLAYNLFTGPIPSEYGTLTELRSLTLTGDGLTGSIPFSLQNLTLLSRLELSGNFDPGPFPEWIGDLPNLGSLNLTTLSGQIQDSLLGQKAEPGILLRSKAIWRKAGPCPISPGPGIAWQAVSRIPK